MIKPDIGTRKQEAVRNAIFDAAIDLFYSKGFTVTTVDQVAEAAGVSQRSFFRYFATKDDVLAFNVINSGKVLVSTLEACSPELPPLELIREIAWASIKFAESRSDTRKIAETSARSLAARRAHKSGRVEVEDQLSEAFAARMKSPSKFNLRPRTMALLTMDVIDLTLGSWFTGEFKDCSIAFEHVFTQLSRVFGKDDAASREASARKRSLKRLTIPKRRDSVAR